MPSPETDFFAILETLTRHGVEFVVVGGVCGVLHGAPISTFDLDVVHARTQENVDRLDVVFEHLFEGRRIGAELLADDAEWVNPRDSAALLPVADGRGAVP